MNDAEARFPRRGTDETFHEQWLGMVQPIEGLVPEARLEALLADSRKRSPPGPPSRERGGRISEAAGTEAVLASDPVNHARRLVAQRCLYGVDKNPFAVDLAKLSLWLETLARDLPFTFLDHALRWGDSLVGLDFEQIRGFHWQPEAQQTLASEALEEALSEAIGLRQEILDLAGEGAQAQRDKERLLRDAEDALSHARLIGDLVVGAFFAHGKVKARAQELAERLTKVNVWLEDGRTRPGSPGRGRRRS